MDRVVREIGEQAMLDLGVHGLHPELVLNLGRLAFKNAWGQNVLAHSKEVATIAGILAAELGLDPRQVRRAGLLHDIGMALDGYAEKKTSELGGDLVKKFGENPAIESALRSLGNDQQRDNLISSLLAIANTLSSARPGVRDDEIGKLRPAPDTDRGHRARVRRRGQGLRAPGRAASCVCWSPTPCSRTTSWTTWPRTSPGASSAKCCIRARSAFPCCANSAAWSWRTSGPILQLGQTVYVPRSKTETARPAGLRRTSP
jgi:putative nucleotidyltransferase with HDIG domain